MKSIASLTRALPYPYLPSLHSPDHRLVLVHLRCRAARRNRPGIPHPKEQMRAGRKDVGSEWPFEPTLRRTAEVLQNVLLEFSEKRYQKAGRAMSKEGRG